jgi:hypothetical protein
MYLSTHKCCCCDEDEDDGAEDDEDAAADGGSDSKVRCRLTGCFESLGTSCSIPGIVTGTCVAVPCVGSIRLIESPIVLR